MNTSAIKKEDYKYTMDNVLEFKKPALIGGPQGPENWLRELEKGTIFLAKNKQVAANSMEGMFLHKFLVVDHRTVSSNLMWAIPDGGQREVWVSTLEFSRKFDLVEVIGFILLGEEQQLSVEERNEAPGQHTEGIPESTA